jgi:hypothetical protein
MKFLNLMTLGQSPRGIKKTQIPKINTGFSVQICEICVKKSKQSFKELNLKILNYLGAEPQRD